MKLAVTAAAAATAVFACSPALVAADCGAGLESCGDACYSSQSYTCFDDSTFCPAGYSLCGDACYNPADYSCSGSALVQGGSGVASSTTAAASVAATTTATTTTTSAASSSTAVAAVAASSSSSSASGAYSLADDFSGSSFFDGFTFYTAADPTNGYVTYVDESTAQSDSLISAGDPTTIGVDTTNVYTSSGRPSVRLTSSKSYNAGTVFVVDLAHMPFGCGTWPAVWLVGPNWPAGGEIDIVEGVNVNTNNQMTLHTSPGCTIDTASQSQTGTNLETDCDATANSNSGCGVSDPSTSSYGDGFNNAGGGVFAVEWISTAIKIWRFDRSSIPSDIAGGSAVSPDGWGTPVAHWPLGSTCSASFFSDMQIVIDDTFCGDWAGSAYGTGCTGGSGSTACEYLVANYPTRFTDAYWSINYIRTFSA
ncbi:hypothetical protein HK405_010218 [Cladochytrium tenue]|nr:hypothetical protein HK405_010218 [Cladochytrium tenue]